MLLVMDASAATELDPPFTCMEIQMMRRQLFGLLAMTGAALSSLHAGLALAQCAGTSGTATINGTPWTATCVIGVTASDCVDSLGNNYECLQILGSNPVDPNYTSVALFIGEPLVQGHTYQLGGGSPNSTNGAVVLGGAAYAITEDDPYTGEMTVDAYNPGTGAIDCTFHFLALALFGGADVNVTDGHFLGIVVSVQESTWTGVKNIYRQ